MKTMINIKTDKNLKESAQEVAREIGLPLSTVVNAYLRNFVEKREIHFTAPFKMKPALEKQIKIAQNDFKKKRNISPVFSNVADAIRYLRSQ